MAKRIRALGLEHEREYVEHLEDDTSGEELVQFLDAISTNFTFFMREPDHFEWLTRWAKEDRIRERRRLRLWCAASASGEEPYSIAITLLDAFGDREVDLKILATDISTRALGAAAGGRYGERSIEPLSREQRLRYLEKHGARGTDLTYEVKPEVKQRVVYRRLNLSAPPYPMKGPIDVVFCRNVMIYFDRDTRQGLISEIERLLAPGGLLFTGHSETLTGINTGVEMLKPSVYRKRESSSSNAMEVS